MASNNQDLPGTEVNAVNGTSLTNNKPRGLLIAEEIAKWRTDIAREQSPMSLYHVSVVPKDFPTELVDPLPKGCVGLRVILTNHPSFLTDLMCGIIDGDSYYEVGTLLVRSELKHILVKYRFTKQRLAKLNLADDHFHRNYVYHERI